MTKARQPPAVQSQANEPQVLTRVDPAGRARLDALVRKATQQAQQPQAQ